MAVKKFKMMCPTNEDPEGAEARLTEEIVKWLKESGAMQVVTRESFDEYHKSRGLRTFVSVLAEVPDKEGQWR